MTDAAGIGNISQDPASNVTLQCFYRTAKSEPSKDRSSHDRSAQDYCHPQRDKRRRVTFNRFGKEQSSVSSGPGPGSYDDGKGHGSRYGKTVISHPWKSQSRKSAAVGNNVPGPGTYYDDKCLFRNTFCVQWKLPVKKTSTSSGNSRPNSAVPGTGCRHKKVLEVPRCIGSDACLKADSGDPPGEVAGESTQRPEENTLEDEYHALEVTRWEKALVKGLPKAQSLRILEEEGKVVITPSALPEDYNVKLLGSSCTDITSMIKLKKKNILEDVMLQRLTREVSSNFRRGTKYRDRCNTKLACILSSLRL